MVGWVGRGADGDGGCTRDRRARRARGRRSSTETGRRGVTWRSRLDAGVDLRLATSRGARVRFALAHRSEQPDVACVLGSCAHTCAAHTRTCAGFDICNVHAYTCETHTRARRARPPRAGVICDRGRPVHVLYKSRNTSCLSTCSAAYTVDAHTRARARPMRSVRTRCPPRTKPSGPRRFNWYCKLKCRARAISGNCISLCTVHAIVPGSHATRRETTMHPTAHTRSFTARTPLPRPRRPASAIQGATAGAPATAPPLAARRRRGERR